MEMNDEVQIFTKSDKTKRVNVNNDERVILN